MRTNRMLGALLHRNWMLVYEEALVLSGTIRGILYGLVVKEGTRVRSWSRSRAGVGSDLISVLE